VRPYLKKNSRSKRAEGVAQEGEHLPDKHKAPSINKTKQKNQMGAEEETS
jgi:hypothetical protein